MELGAHLPLIDFSNKGISLAYLKSYAKLASDLGYSYLCANDHLIFSRPWFDGPVALSSVIEESGRMMLATTVSIPVVRGPVVSAKMFTAIDILSGGRLVVGVGPGSSPRDHNAVGLPFEERFKRMDETVQMLRSLWDRDSTGFNGRFYSSEGITLEPLPVRKLGPPIWIASWGSKLGLRRAARLGDGWLASAYNTTPVKFKESLALLFDQLKEAGKKPDGYANGLATMWAYVTDDASAAERILNELLAPALNRPSEELREQLPIGSPELCAERLSAYAAAGVQRVFLWPLADELRQLERFTRDVLPLVNSTS